MGAAFPLPLPPRPRDTAPVAIAPAAAPAAAPLPEATAPTIGVTNRINAGSANKATIINVNPVIEPTRASCPLVLPIKRNATEYTMAAAGL
jgi:hypothetical protein